MDCNNNQAQAMECPANLSFQVSYFQPMLAPQQSPCYYLIPASPLNYSFSFPYPPLFPYSLQNQLEHSQTLVNTPPQHPIEEKPPRTHQNPAPIKKAQRIHSSNKPIIKYSKKNVESNVINQIFSYISLRSKSHNILSKLLKGREDLIQIYFQVMKQLKKHNKKYINRQFIRTLMEMRPEHTIHSILRKIDANHLLGLERLKGVLRTAVIYYVRQLCNMCILRSEKIDKATRLQHMQRRREIETYLTYHIKYSMDPQASS